LGWVRIGAAAEFEFNVEVLHDLRTAELVLRPVLELTTVTLAARTVRR